MYTVGLLFGLTMLMVSIALVMAVIVTNIYLRKDSTKPVPHFTRRLFIGRTSNSSPAPGYRRCTVRGTERTSSVVEPSTTAGSRRRVPGKRSTRSRRSDLASGESGPSLTEVQRKEWQILAKAVDRLFFWIFLVISVGSLLAMYIRIPM